MTALSRAMIARAFGPGSSVSTTGQSGRTFSIVFVMRESSFRLGLKERKGREETAVSRRQTGTAGLSPGDSFCFHCSAMSRPRPTLATVPLIVSYMRFLRGADELTRKIQMDAMAVGFAAGSVARLVSPLLQRWAETGDSRPGGGTTRPVQLYDDDAGGVRGGDTDRPGSPIRMLNKSGRPRSEWKCNDGCAWFSHQRR